MTELDLSHSPAIARVLDFETTGYPEDESSEIIEAGTIDVDLLAEGFPIVMESCWTSLFKPSGFIPAATMAIHHIMDADVADAPPSMTVFPHLLRGMTEADVYAAHNAKFEQHFFNGRGRSYICTYKCALRAWPDAPNHTNQGLRYHLQLPCDRKLSDPPHRALPDAYVTAHILQALLRLRPLGRLVEISKEPAFLTNITFGKHRGKSFKEVAQSDRGYLSWIIDKSDMDEDVKFSAQWWLEKSNG
ncbi:exonuclease domain-containing protein [Devosia riboflavina]|uniref:exonuclease domain-containing protein n=1 Tax=Devosia riboflavina TaxID=46914 RepID=UPI00068EB7BE|nr:exonuclease domain-containing protein [Devosia riboflavina]